MVSWGTPGGPWEPWAHWYPNKTSATQCASAANKTVTAQRTNQIRQLKATELDGIMWNLLRPSGALWFPRVLKSIQHLKLQILHILQLS